MSRRFWLSDREIAEVVRMGRALCEAYPRSRFFSIGQSPAWIIEALQLDATQRGLHVETGLVPFSGGFCFSERDLALPTVQNFRNILCRIGADPETVVEKYERKGLKTTFTDFCLTGFGLNSFLRLSCLFAEESGLLDRYASALNIHVYATKGMRDIHDLDMCDSLLPKETVTFVDSSIQVSLWNCHNNCRNVPLYPFAPVNLWKNPYPMAEGDEDIVVETYKKIGAEVKRQSPSRLLKNCF